MLACARLHAYTCSQLEVDVKLVYQMYHPYIRIITMRLNHSKAISKQKII